MVTRCLVNDRVHFENVGGYLTTLEKTTLLGEAETGSEGGEDHIEDRGDDAVVAIDHRNRASVLGSKSRAQGGRGAGRLFWK